MQRTVLLWTAVLTLASLGVLARTALAQTPHTHEHGFSGAQQWATIFDDPQRDAWQKPHKVLMALQLKPDGVVADVGSGTGYFTVRLAHFVAKGRVYGVDIEPDMVKYLADRAKRAGESNVTALLGQPDSPNLPEKVDLVLMVDTFHHIAERGRYFNHLKASLKPDGRVAIIDFNEASPMGPPPSERLPAATVKSELARAGYALTAEHTFLPNQYFLEFKLAKP
jgi:ubiquinone/menaquinone biosynthesis C-methylase UbiE